MATNIVDVGLNVIATSTSTKITGASSLQSIEISGTASTYFVLTSPNGTRFKLSVSNAGAISATSSGTF